MKKLIYILLSLMLCAMSAGCSPQGEYTETVEQETSAAVLCGKNASSVYDDLKGPESGTAALDEDLAEKLMQAQADALFDVRIYLYYDVQEFLYEGQPVEYYENAAVLREYNEAYHKWYNEEYEALDRKMTQAEESGEEYAMGWWKHTPESVFYELWAKEQTEETIAEYEAAVWKRDAAMIAYDEWKYYSDAEETDKRERAQAELARLNEQGYDLTFRRNSIYSMTGVLSKEQIESFPASKTIGYMITWNAKPVENKADQSREVVNLSAEGDFWDEYVPGAGDVNMSGGVGYAKREAEYAECLLDLSFDIVSMGEALFLYEGMTLYEMQQSELMEKYDGQETDDDPELNDFIARYHEAYNAMDEWDGGAAFSRALEEEFVRLETAGYPIVRNGSGFDAKLTQEQLKSFSYDPRYGYMVGWRHEPVEQEPSITDTIPEYNRFESVKEMAKFLKNLPDEADTQGMKLHGRYYVPKDVPEGFGLAWISVYPYSGGVHYIYLPEEYLELPDAEQELAEGKGLAFTFEYSVYEEELLIYAGYPQGNGNHVYLEGDDVARTAVNF